MKRLQYALHDQLIIWMVLWTRRYGLPTRPRWLCWLWREIGVSFNERTFVPKLIAAQEANIGLHEVWAEPTTPPGDILGWFDAQITLSEKRPLTPAQQKTLSEKRPLTPAQQKTSVHWHSRLV